jgi:hypothetical protein
MVFPGAVHSERQNEYHDDGYHFITAPGIEKPFDGVQEEATAILRENMWMESWSYGLPYYAPYLTGDPFAPYSYLFVDPAPDNSTINWIKAVAIFTFTVGHQPSNPHLSYSINGGGSYHTNATSALTFDASFSPYYYIYWNITAFQAWTPAMVKSASLRVIVWFDGLAGNEYVLDYVGLQYVWTTIGFSYGPPGITPGGGGFGSLSLDAMGAFGLIGFFGMIAIPAASVWMAQRSEQPRIVFGLQMVLMFVVCLGLFLASIS